MRRDSRLSVALHVLLHMNESTEPFTSERIGLMVEANPVVLRRTLGRLKEAGLLTSSKGHGGGWLLAKPLKQVRLSEIYDALETSGPFALGPHRESPGCIVEQAVNRAIGKALRDAEEVLRASLEKVTVDALAREVRQQDRKRKKTT